MLTESRVKTIVDDIVRDRIKELSRELIVEIIDDYMQKKDSREEDRGWAREAFLATQAKLEEEMDDDELTLTITY